MRIEAGARRRPADDRVRTAGEDSGEDTGEDRGGGATTTSRRPTRVVRTAGEDSGEDSGEDTGEDRGGGATTTSRRPGENRG